MQKFVAAPFVLSLRFCDPRSVCYQIINSSCIGSSVISDLTTTGNRRCFDRYDWGSVPSFNT